MIARYSLPEMASIWSDERKLALWQEVEALAAEAWAEAEVAPPDAAKAIRDAPPIDADAWRAREEVTHHDLAAFVDVLTQSVGDQGRWVHYGLTSSDVIDTAQAVLMREAVDLLLSRIVALFAVVRDRAMEHRDTLMAGRTHGMWAEPTTFGLKLAGWAFELERDHRRMKAARRAVAVGKVSGAVGTYAHVPPEIEQHVCDRLGLDVEPAATQVTARDRHAELLAALALTGASLERFAVEIRHLQRSEVAEVREPFAPGQKGSSAMPHKQNPIIAENASGLARLLRGYLLAGLENIALWHERDISHSSVERVALPDACLILDFALHRMTSLVERLVVDESRMRANVEGSRGTVFSQAVLHALIDAGMTRGEAYETVQRNALKATDEGEHLRDLLAADPGVPLSEKELASCFDPDRLLRHSNVVFDRLEKLEL